jgi:hypothetical protein
MLYEDEDDTEDEDEDKDEALISDMLYRGCGLVPKIGGRRHTIIAL